MPWDDDDDQPRYRRGRRRRDDEPPEAGPDSVMIYPVVSAAYYGSVPAVGAALREGGDVDELDAKESWRPLHAAVFTESEDVVQYLISVRAQVNLPGPSGMTALHMAARDNSMDCCQLLLAAKADPSLKDEDGHTPVDLATARGSQKALRMLEAFSRGGSEAHIVAARDACSAPAEQSEPDPLEVAAAAAARSKAERGAHTFSSAPLMRRPCTDGKEEAAVIVETNERSGVAAMEEKIEPVRSSGPVYGSMVDPDDPRNNPDLTIDDLEFVRE